MTACHVQASGTVELHFYGELSAPERGAFERHLAGCDECRRALEELAVIRDVLGSRADVAAPAGGDWSRFMARLDTAIRGETSPQQHLSRPRRPMTALLAMAALLALVTAGAVVALRTRAVVPPDSPAVSTRGPAGVATAPAPSTAGNEGLSQLSEQHFKRSKLVVLGLATRNPADATGVDWNYERTLATSLLSDTRLYRQAAEERGMKSLAGVMSDLELLLLQTSMSETPDGESLAQLQQLIRRRDLLTKMDAVTTAGL